MVITQLLLEQIKTLPASPGVYLFKDINHQIVYVGKAKNLRNRVNQYVQRLGVDLKSQLIFEVAAAVDHIVTATELDALLLEAQLIQNHRPRFNVLLKDGQPFLWLMVAARTSDELPVLELVRNKKKRGQYFGPFLEKGHARQVYDFLIKTLRLKLCGKKIEGGCLYYHLGSCAGSCRPDFDAQGYRERIGLAQLALQKGHKKFLQHLRDEIAQCNRALQFERSRDLHRHLEAFERVFDALASKGSGAALYVKKDVWVLSDDGSELYFFEERDGVLKQREYFYFYVHQDPEQCGPLDETLRQAQGERITTTARPEPVEGSRGLIQIFIDPELHSEKIKEYFLSVYRQRRPAHVILTNVDFGADAPLFQEFLQSLHGLDHEPSIQVPHEGHYAQIMKMALIQIEQDRTKRQSLGAALKKLLLLPRDPVTIDCFDISHKQGTFMVGACVRFTKGKPEPSKFRHFKINTVVGQNDYASLREIVARRYSSGEDIPDLILIDGGKGQLHAVDDLLPGAEFAALAKREETIFSARIPEGKVLDKQMFAGQVLIALRDYTHHFAISYHRKLADQVGEK